jgi:hypothetical protein
MEIISGLSLSRKNIDFLQHAAQNFSLIIHTTRQIMQRKYLSHSNYAAHISYEFFTTCSIPAASTRQTTALVDVAVVVASNRAGFGDELTGQDPAKPGRIR